TMTLMATDRYRLALRELTWNPATPGAEQTALVRGRTLHEVARSLSTGGSVDIALSDDADGNLIGFESGGRRTTSTLVDGEYPPERRLLHETTDITDTVANGALIEAVKLVPLVPARTTPDMPTFSHLPFTLTTLDDKPPDRLLHSVTIAIIATVAPGSFIDAYKRGSLVDERNTPVRLSFTEGQVALEAGAGDDAQASEVLEAQLEGEDLVVGFNSG